MAWLALSTYSPTPANPRQWNKIIKHQVFHESPQRAFLTFTKMLEAGHNADNYTLPILLKAATHFPTPHTGAALHGLSIKTGFSIHDFVQTALISMYSALGYIDVARQVFNKMSQRDLISWNSMLNAYASQGMMDSAFELFNSMPVKDRISFNTMVFGYSNIGQVNSAEEIFNAILDKDIFSWNSMISAYVKTGNVEEGRALFDRIPERNVVSWNTLISGYLQTQQYNEAIDLFYDMKAGKIQPNHITLVSVLSACAHIGSLEIGRKIHIHALETGLALNTHVSTSLIDMYAKCGLIEQALQVFYKVQQKDIYCWNSMISGLAIHGYGKASIELFNDMRSKGMRPDDITFIALLSACSHSGMVKEGYSLFLGMFKDYGLEPKGEHYGCIVDLLGRAGLLDRAYELIEGMPFEPGVTVLGALLGACIVHRNVEMGEIVAKLLAARGDCLGDGEYIMLVNMYAMCGRWEEARRWRGMMNDSGIRKTAGCSVIEVNGALYRFLAGDLEGLQSSSRGRALWMDGLSFGMCETTSRASYLSLTSLGALVGFLHCP